MSILSKALLLYVTLYCGSACAQNATTKGDCSPIVQMQGGTSSLTIDCGHGMSVEQLAKHNLETMISAIRYLLITQQFYFMPALRNYSSKSTSENWNLVLGEITRTQKALDATIDTSTAYFASVDFESPKLAELANVLGQRGALLADLRESAKSFQKSSQIIQQTSGALRDVSNSPAPINLDDWTMRYRSLMERLNQQLNQFAMELHDVDKIAAIARR